MIKSDAAKAPTKSILALSVVSLLLLAVAVAVGFSNESVTQQQLSLSANESINLEHSSNAYSGTTKEFEFDIPAATPNSKLLEVGNSQESVSIFKVGNRVNLVFTGQGTKKIKFVSDPVGIPMDFDGSNYLVSVAVNEPSGVVSLSTSYVDYNWKVPSVIGFSNIEYVKSGNATDFKIQLKVRKSLDKSLLFSLILLFEVTFIVLMLRKQIYFFFLGRASTYKNNFSYRQKMHFVLLALGLASLVFLPPEPPAGLLSSGSVDLKKVTSSDLILKNEQLNGGWLFRNSPNVTYNVEDYSSTLKFEMDVFLRPDNPDTEIFAYGIPYRKESTPRSKRNLEVRMNAEPGIFFRIPSQRQQGQFYSKDLSAGIHKISGEIRSGREWEITVDGKLVYAMSSQVPFVLLQNPNLFVSEYLLENLVSGRVSWEVNAEAAAPAKYAMYRLQTFATFILLFLSITLICLRIMRAETLKRRSDTESLRVLKFSYLTFVALSTVGALFWSLKLQPVSSLTSTTRNNPLFLPEFRFSDFYQIFMSSQNQDPFSIAGVVYPPFGMLVFDLAGFLSARQGVLVFLSLTMGVITAFFAKSISSRSDFTFRDKSGVIVTTCLAFPVIFAFDRGNLDLLIAALLIFGVWFNLKNSNSYATGIIIGVASAIKIYPLFLLPIFYYQRRDLRLVVACLGTFSLLSALGALRYNLEMVEFVKTVMLGSAGQELDLNSALRWNGSLAALITTLVGLVAPQHATEIWTVLSNSKSTILLLALSGTMALWLAKRRVDVTIFAIAWLSMISLAFPLTTAYKFTVFLVAFAFLITVGMQSAQKSREIGILLGVIVSPVVFWFLGKGQVNTFSLIVPTATISLIFVILTSTRKKKKHKLPSRLPSRL